MSLTTRSSDSPLRIDDRPLVEEFFKYLGVFRRGWRYIAVSLLICLTIAALYLFQLKTEFRGSARLLILHQGGRPLRTVVSGGKDPFDAVADYDDTTTHIMVIRSPAIIERALAAAGLRNRSLEEVEQRLRVTRPDPTVKILEIGYQAATFEEAIKIVDAVVASYKKFLEDNYQKNTADVLTLIAEVRDQLSEELEDLERKYLEFHRQHPTFAVGANGRSLLVRRLDQWDAAANESMMRAVKLQAQLELARQLEKQGAGLATIGTTLRYLGDGKEEVRLAGFREGASDRSEQTGEQLADVERQRRTTERLIEHLRAKLADMPAPKPVSEPEVVDVFLADPEVSHLRDQLSSAESRRDGIQRVVRNARDPSLTQAQRRVTALQDELDTLWRRRRSMIIDNVSGSSNSEVEAAIRHEEASLIVLKSRESVLREEMAAIRLGSTDPVPAPGVSIATPSGPTDQETATPAPSTGSPATVRSEAERLTAEPGHPDRNRIHEMLDSIERGFKANEAMRAEMTRRFKEDLAAGKEAEIDQLEEENLRANLERQRSFFNSVVDQLKQAQLVSDHSTITAQLVHPPSAAALRPRQAIVLALALFIGSGLGLACLAFVADLFDDRLRTLPALRGSLEFSVLGLIPQIPDTTASSVGSVGMISHNLPRSLVAESYKSIRTRLDFHRRNHRLDVLLIASPSSGDGKSTSASNLAISMAHTGRKVLLVDADLRRPSLHTNFTLNRSRGLVQVLKDMLPVAQVIQGTGIENLDLIAAGPEVTNPAELLASPRFATFLAEVRQSHDTIIIDSSPLLAVADPLIVGSMADGVILIVRVETLNRRQAERTAEMLQALGALVLGTVINGIKRQQAGYGYGYGYDFGFDYGDVARSNVSLDAETDRPPAAEHVTPNSRELTNEQNDLCPKVIETFIEENRRNSPFA